MIVTRPQKETEGLALREQRTTPEQFRGDEIWDAPLRIGKNLRTNGKPCEH